MWLKLPSTAGLIHLLLELVTNPLVAASLQQTIAQPRQATTLQDLAATAGANPPELAPIAEEALRSLTWIAVPF